MAASELVSVLELEETAPDRYVGRNLEGTKGVIFGGQLLAQAIAAAARSAPDMHVKSMHTIFLRGAHPTSAWCSKSTASGKAHVSISTSVITQTLAYHDAFEAGDWLLLAHRSPYAGHGRSFGRADVYTRDGRLVASYAQENMIRAFAPDRTPAAGERSKY